MPYEIIVPAHTNPWGDAMPATVYGRGETESAAWREACGQLAGGSPVARAEMIGRMIAREVAGP